MEAIFKAICKNGKLFFQNSFDLERYCLQYEGTEMLVNIKQLAKTGPKMRLYAFYHGPLLDCAVIGFRQQGYDGVDKVKADYLLRAEFAKDFILKPNGETVTIMIDKSSMTKERLMNFVNDCLLYIEQNLEMEVPDSEEYKINKSSSKSGRYFTKVK